MTPRQANLLTLLGLLGLLAVVTLTAPRWARLLRQPLGSTEDEPVPGIDAGTKARAGEKEAERQISVRLYFEAPEQVGLLPEERSVPFSDDLSRQLRMVVEELVRGSTTGLLPTLPAGTKVLEVFVTARGIAYLDLSKEVVELAEGGSKGELLTVYSIVNSLTANFPAVKRVQILVEDKPVLTLAGHVDLSRPLLPDLTFVALATPSPSPGAPPAPTP
jgi:spore germination protein GerM